MIKSYHRPESIEQALQLLARDGVKTAVLSGQSVVDARLDDTVDEIIDLQALGLHRIESTPSGLRIEALVTLQMLLEHPALAQPLRDIIHMEEPNTLRNMRTISSVILTPDAESQLVAALLAADAKVSIQNVKGKQQIPLADFLQDVGGSLAGGLVTAMTLDTSGQMAAARVARTPADKPIVAAVARRGADGSIWLALCGVDKTPVLIEPHELDSLNPPADFRGSTAYRKQMALVLSRRVLDELERAS